MNRAGRCGFARLCSDTPGSTAATIHMPAGPGVRERAVMDMMGWSNSAMVKRYAHVTARLRRDIEDRLNEFFWKGK